VVPDFERFVIGPQLIRKAIVGLDPGLLNRPDLDGWSIRDVVIHMADTELVASVRFRSMLTEDEPQLTGFDEKVWKKKLNYLFRDPDGALSLFQQARYANAELLREGARQIWARTGVHRDRGIITVADLLRIRADHDDEHVEQIAGLRGR
jgi:hypothetical protein